MNKRIPFTNISKPLTLAFEPVWQKEIIKRVEEEYSEQALFISEKFRQEVLGLDVYQVFFGTAVLGLIKKTPKLAYIKNIKAEDKIYEAEIDLLAHTVAFWSVYEEDCP